MSSPIASNSIITIDYINGPASRSADQTITGFWEFRSGVSLSADVDIYDDTGTKFAIFSSTSSGRFGLGDVTPEAYFEIASSSGIVASISNIFSIDATNNRLNITGVASISSNFEVGGYASIGNPTASNTFAGSLNVSKGINALSYQGGGLQTCNTTTGKLVWNAGQFSCGTDLDTDTNTGGPVSDGLDISTTGGTYFSIASLQFDANGFNMSSPIASNSIITIDYINGPASRSDRKSVV